MVGPHQEEGKLNCEVGFYKAELEVSSTRASGRPDNSRKQSSWLLDSVKLLVLVGFSWSYVFVFFVCVWFVLQTYPWKNLNS